MYIREALPSEAEEVVSFHWATLLASHDGPGPKLGPPSLWARDEVREYYRGLRIKGVQSESIKSVVAFSGEGEEEGEGQGAADSLVAAHPRQSRRGEIIGHIDFGPPGGFSPLSDFCELELLSVYSAGGRGKGVARQLIKYALQRAVADGSMKPKPKGEEAIIPNDVAPIEDNVAPAAENREEATTQPAYDTTPTPPKVKKSLGVITIRENLIARNFYTKLGGELLGEFPVTLFGTTIICVAFTWTWDGVEKLMS